MSNVGEVKQDIAAFSRKLRLMEYYKNKSTDNDVSLVKNKGTFTPERGRSRTLDIIIDNLARIPVTSSEKRKHNLTKEESTALKRLRENGDIIIKEADKGSGVVIMNKEFYVRKIDLLLSDTTTYREISENLDTTIMKKMKSFTTKHKRILTKKEAQFISEFPAKTSRLYGLPKLHKSAMITAAKGTQSDTVVRIIDPDDLTFRPIVAGPACPTHRLSQFLDIILKPLLSHIRSYIKDTMDFLSKFRRTTTTNAILCTLDVVSLYPSIPHDLGIEAVGFWVDQYPNTIDTRFTKEFLTEAVALVLQNNNFEFNERHFLQTRGTAMGTNMAPTYANLTLGYLEVQMDRKITESFGPNISTYVQHNYWRFLDDCYITWEYSDEELNKLIEMINSMNPMIKFVATKSVSQISFLDVLITKENTRLKTEIYHKTTDTRCYVPFDSNHPRHIKANIPYTLARRVRTITDLEEDEAPEYVELKETLGKLSYPRTLINSAIERVKQVEKEGLRNPEEARKEEENITFVTTFNPNNSNVFPLIQTLYSILQWDPDLKDTFQNKLIHSRRQPKNLKKMLCPAKLATEGRISRCGKPRCQLCNIIVEGDEHTFNNGEKFKFKSNMTCDSTNVIYCIICQGCNAEYIGETKSLRHRMNLHKEQTKNARHRILNVNRHIWECAMKKNVNPAFKFLPMYHVYAKDDAFRLHKEELFITKFKPALNC